MRTTRKQTSKPTKKTTIRRKLKAKALVLTCMDFRFRVNLGRLLNLHKQYDEVILAGGCLGYNLGHQKKTIEKFPNTKNINFKHWASVLDDHLQLAITLHGIEEIVVVDHLQCGGYQMFKHNHDGKLAQQTEIESHLEEFQRFTALMRKHPLLAVRQMPVRCLVLAQGGRKIVYDATQPKKYNLENM